MHSFFHPVEKIKGQSGVNFGLRGCSHLGCAKSIGTMVIASIRLEPCTSNFVSLSEISIQRCPENFKTFELSAFD